MWFIQSGRAWPLVWIAAGVLFIVNGVLLYGGGGGGGLAETVTDGSSFVAEASAGAGEAPTLAATPVPSQAAPPSLAAARPSVPQAPAFAPRESTASRPAPVAVTLPGSSALPPAAIAPPAAPPATTSPEPTPTAPLAVPAATVPPTVQAAPTAPPVTAPPTAALPTAAPPPPTATPAPDGAFAVLEVDFDGRVERVDGSVVTVAVTGEEREEVLGCGTVVVRTEQAEMRGSPAPGSWVRVRGDLTSDCHVNATRFRVEDDDD